jgi:hypothetical protein
VKSKKARMQRFEQSLQISLDHLQSFGRLFFTPKQLYYEFCRQGRSIVGLEPKTAAALFGLSAIPVLFAPKHKLSLLTASAAIFGALAFSRNIPRTLTPPVAWDLFETNLTNYLQKNEIRGLLKIEEKVVFSNKYPNDLTLYGLPRLLICESIEIAQMLRANQFHLQTPCAVLSLNEANPLKDSFQKMLGNAENPHVFFLHDANFKSSSLIPNLRQILQLKEEIPLRSIGLKPVHARRLHLFAKRDKTLVTDFDFSILNHLDESEINWFKNGFTSEVSAVSPIRLLRVLRRVILGLEVPASDWQIKLPPKKLGFI